MYAIDVLSSCIGAAVCHFSARVDGRIIEGVVKENEQAQTDYDQAIQSGRAAFMVEQKLPDVFKVLLFSNRLTV